MHTNIKFDIMGTKDFLLAKPEYFKNAFKKRLPILEIEFNVAYRTGITVKHKVEKMKCYLKHEFKPLTNGGKIELVAVDKNNRVFLNFAIICCTKENAESVFGAKLEGLVIDDEVRLVDTSSILRYHKLLAKELLIGEKYNKVLSITIGMVAVEELDLYQSNYLMNLVVNYDLAIFRKISRVIVKALAKLIDFVNIKILRN
jgi:hypothetical protein